MSCRSFHACLLLSVGLFAAANATADAILLVRERNSVERWQVKDGAWTRQGEFLNGRSAGLAPMSVTAGGGLVYLATVKDEHSGTIEVYSPTGEHKRTLVAETLDKPDQICLSPDGKWLYATVIYGSVMRYSLSDGTGSVIIEGLQRARMLKFGPEGYLYVTSDRNQAIVVYDVSGEKPKKVGEIETVGHRGGFAFGGKYFTKLLVPGDRCESIDLVANATAPFSRSCFFRNSFSSVRVGNEVYVGDYFAGTVSHLPYRPGAIKVVAQGVGGVSSMVNLTAELDGAERREMTRIWNKMKGAGKAFVYAEPRMPPGMDLERMMFNNPGLEVDLSAGIWPGMRICKDGVVIHTGSVPRDITRYYERIGDVLFKAGVETTWAKAPPDKNRRSLGYGLPQGVETHFRKYHSVGRHFADFNGDGVMDCIDLYSDWTEYGVPGPKCPVAYDADEHWTNNQIQVFAYVHFREGAGANGTWRAPVPILCDGKKDLQGPFANGGAVFDDFNGDGLMDMITGDFRSSLWYLENVGTKEAPAFARGRPLLDAKGRVIEGDLCMMDIRGDDWNGDGKIDIVATEEDGRASVFLNTGRVVDGMPIFEGQRFFRQKADELKFGCLATPWCVDWDGDGDWDIIAGNSGGYIAFIENLSGKGVEKPKWAEPKVFTVKDPQHCTAAKWLKGNVIHSWCGDENSPQGPAEAKWGYTVVSVADWDGDGYLDILANDVKGSVVYIRNPGKVGTTVMEAPKAIEVEWEGEQPRFSWEWRKPTGKVLRAPWRTTPIAYDWTGDGLTDLIMLDAEGYLALYERGKKPNGQLYLKHPRRCFLDKNGEPMRANPNVNGGSGRRKMSICDWDGDGKPDLVMNSVNAYVEINQGTDASGNTRFVRTAQLARKKLAGHTCCPSPCDFDGDGIPDLCIGAEDGHFYYLKNPRAFEK